MRQSDRWTRRPQAGPQQALVLCPYKEIFFGGTRGGGKTDGVFNSALSVRLFPRNLWINLPPLPEPPPVAAVNERPAAHMRAARR